MSRISTHLPTNVTLGISTYKIVYSHPHPQHSQEYDTSQMPIFINSPPAPHEIRAETANEGDAVAVMLIFTTGKYITGTFVSLSC